MALSKGMSVEFTSTSALEPGYAIKMFTRGGAISGNCETGRVFIASNPRNTKAIEIAMANTGRCINLLNMLLYLGLNVTQRVADLIHPVQLLA